MTTAKRSERFLEKSSEGAIVWRRKMSEWTTPDGSDSGHLGRLAISTQSSAEKEGGDLAESQGMKEELVER